MKLTYRGVSYEYTPPAVESAPSENVGKYRGLDIRFRNPQKTPVLETNLDLVYRGAAYQASPAQTAEAPAPVVTSAPAAPMQATDRARTLLMNHHRAVKRRQQTMLSRLATEVGMTADTSKYWNHIQGKVHPSFWGTYDRKPVMSN